MGTEPSSAVRHLLTGTVLAAASQRTRRIALGTAVIPLGWENPLRLAEDLATVDLLADGRLNPGLSVGPPMRWDDVKDGLYPDTAELEDFSYERVARLLKMVRGEPISPFRGTVGIEEFSSRVEPHSPTLAEQLYAHAVFREVDEVPFALPFSFEHEDYVQILTDIATRLGLTLGRGPAASAA